VSARVRDGEHEYVPTTHDGDDLEGEALEQCGPGASFVSDRQRALTIALSSASASAESMYGFAMKPTSGWATSLAAAWGSP